MNKLHSTDNDQPEWFAGILAAVVLLLLYTWVY